MAILCAVVVQRTTAREQLSRFSHGRTAPVGQKRTRTASFEFDPLQLMQARCRGPFDRRMDWLWKSPGQFSFDAVKGFVAALANFLESLTDHKLRNPRLFTDLYEVAAGDFHDAV